MAGAVQKYFEQGLAPSTRKTYGAASKLFCTFCAKYQVSSPFPVSEYTLCCFAAYLADEGLTAQTAKSYLSAVRNLQLSLGLPDPRDQSSLPVLKRVLAGIIRTRLAQNVAPRVRLPITAQILARIHGSLVHSSRPDSTLIWVVAATAFFGFFRLGELLVESPRDYSPTTSLSWGNVAVDSRTSPSMVKVHLRRSKCDQLGRGVDVVVGRTDKPLCPVSAILDYIHLCHDSRGDNSPATKSWFVTQIRDILSSIGLPQSDYAGHSFRIGAATTAAMVGVEDSTIQALGRSAFLQYIRMPQGQLAAISHQLATAGCPPSPLESTQA